MGNGNISVGNQSSPRKSGQQQMAGAMSQQGAPVMGDNQCSPQKFVRLVGCHDPKAKARLRGPPTSRSGETVSPRTAA